MLKLMSLKPGRYDRENRVSVGERVYVAGFELTFREEKAVLEIGDGANLRAVKIELAKMATLRIGEGCSITGRISVGAYSKVCIGANTTVTDDVFIRAVENTNVDIGDDCMFASGVIIRTNDGHPIYSRSTGERLNPSQPIVIGRHVWLGDDAAVLKGVTIGEGAIVGMRSVVTKDVQANTLVVGVPAKVIKRDIEWERSARPTIKSA